jgi:beta-galactosidase/beta-glucuronidase
MRRGEWMNLNGSWDYAILPREAPAPAQFDGKILVPYAVESALSGVQQPLRPDQRLWYRRFFSVPAGWEDKKVLLHFGAVDYECRVWVNGIPMAAHTGGYLPFSFDITDTIQPGDNELLVSVWDPTDTGLQQRGKQVLKPSGIWYTAVSGIWQTVWLEPVPENSIESIKLTPDLDHQVLTVELKTSGGLGGVQAEVEALIDGRSISQAGGDASAPLSLPVPEPRAWSPGDPFLYDLQVRLLKDGQVLDQVDSYFAMRKFEIRRDAAGHPRFALNGDPLFLYGPLDQGYFPDGLYTAPSEEAMLFDIEYARRAGCNMIRKHVKVEPLRWYYTCDRLGMIVWQDLPNGGLIDGERVAILSMLFGFHRNDTRRLERFGRAEKANRLEYTRNLEGMIDLLYNAACIAAWVPFNESWGQFEAKKIAEWIKSHDGTRLVDHASGWFDQGGGDFQSKHIYVKKLKRPRPDKRAFVISEFGGYSLKVPGHLWDEDEKFGYRFYDSPEALLDAYAALLENDLLPLIRKGLAAAVYTQTTDVETEINGYLSYDRKVEKMDAGRLRELHTKLIQAV